MLKTPVLGACTPRKNAPQSPLQNIRCRGLLCTWVIFFFAHGPLLAQEAEDLASLVSEDRISASMEQWQEQEYLPNLFGQTERISAFSLLDEKLSPYLVPIDRDDYDQLGMVNYAPVYTETWSTVSLAIDQKEMKLYEDVIFLFNSPGNVDLEAETIFLGYGYDNDFPRRNIAGKVAILFRDPKGETSWAKQVEKATARGVAAIILVDYPNKEAFDLAGQYFREEFQLSEYSLAPPDSTGNPPIFLTYMDKVAAWLEVKPKLLEVSMNRSKLGRPGAYRGIPNLKVHLKLQRSYSEEKAAFLAGWSTRKDSPHPILITCGMPTQWIHSRLEVKPKRTDATALVVLEELLYVADRSNKVDMRLPPVLVVCFGGPAKRMVTERALEKWLTEKGIVPRLHLSLGNLGNFSLEKEGQPPYLLLGGASAKQVHDSLGSQVGIDLELMTPQQETAYSYQLQRLAESNLQGRGLSVLAADGKAELALLDDPNYVDINLLARRTEVLARLISLPWPEPAAPPAAEEDPEMPQAPLDPEEKEAAEH